MPLTCVGTRPHCRALPGWLRNPHPSAQPLDGGVRAERLVNNLSAATNQAPWIKQSPSDQRSVVLKDLSQSCSQSVQQIGQLKAILGRDSKVRLPEMIFNATHLYIVTRILIWIHH